MASADVQEILNSAQAHQVELWFEGERLRFRAPSGALPPELRASLSEHRPEILAALREQASGQVVTSPLAYGQQALWFIQQTEPDSAAYNVAFTGRICSPVEIEALRGAFQALVDRHPLLRATVTSVDGSPMLQMRGYAPVHFTVIDAAGWNDADCYERVRRDYATPFDLEHGPILRVSLYQRSAQESILLINVHHIAVDGWSVWILLDELRQIYAANTGGAAANLPRPAAQYTDFVAWQREMMDGPAGEAQWAYWKEQLSGSLPVLSLPTDHPRPAVLEARGGSVDFTIPEDTTRALRELARKEGVTLYTLLAAAFQVLLYRYSGQEDLITGLATFGREKAEYAQVIGHFINMVPLRIDASGDPTFHAFLVHVREHILGGLGHQEYPFPQLVARLGGHRDASRSPLFQVTFDVQHIQSSTTLTELFIPGNTDKVVDMGGLQLQQYHLPQQEGQFDLSMMMVDLENMLPGTLKYHSDLYDDGTVRQMVQHYQQLLREIAHDPMKSISSYELLTPAERQRILVEWNQTEREYPRNLTIPQLFEAQVERTPDAVAVIFGEDRLTYRELNAQANRMARRLRALGVGPDTLVGMFLERSMEVIITAQAIMKAGGAYVPMDPMYPPQRIQMMIEDSQMPVLITQSSLSGDLPEHSATVVLVDEARSGGEAIDNLPLLAGPDNIAYVIFTSGSTGRPKGVQVLHRGLVNLLDYAKTAPGIGPADTMIGITTLSFDAAVADLNLPLISGARLLFVGAEISTDGVALAEAIERHNGTYMIATPATYHLLLETGWKGRPGMKCTCGGEPLPPVMVDVLAGPDRELWNLYGPTETTIWSTGQKISPHEKVITIGRPIANTRVYILDAHMQPVPIGVAGQMYVGGDGLARGYVNRPDLTAERFLPDPFIPGQRVYATGDLARYLPDGRIEYFGRADSQVKIRGYRIELGEIESVLSQHPSIRQAAVIVREDTPSERRLVAYITAETEVTVRALSKFLREKLPTYMVPSSFVTMDSLPRTPSGKIDRRALQAAPPPERESSDESNAVAQPPSTPSETLLAETWQKVLQVKQVSISDNFFDLGGHSLLAMRVVTDVQARTGVRLEPAYLRFESLGQLAARLDARLAEKDAA